MQSPTKNSNISIPVHTVIDLRFIRHNCMQKWLVSDLPKITLILLDGALLLNDRKHGVKSTRQGIKPLKIVFFKDQTTLKHRRSEESLLEIDTHTRTWTLIFIEELLLRSHAYDELVKANKVLLPSNFLSNMFSKPKSSQEENQGLSHPAARCSKFPFLCCSLAWSYVIEKKFAGGWNWHLGCWCNICSGKMIILI